MITAFFVGNIGFKRAKRRRRGEGVFQTFYQYCTQKKYWAPHTRVLLAVSGGVDSMVLLDLMQKMARMDSLDIGVVHVNHGLRAESTVEEEFLENYCAEMTIPFYSRSWEGLDKRTNIEAQAREFRYQFFAEIMEKKAYTTLVTAHHRDDQAETILMKLTRGSSLINMLGIRDIRSFQKGKLIRPLLLFSKDSLLAYAQKNTITYFEDVTNQSDHYTRNRMRHQIVPLLKQENKQFLQHIASFSEQVELATEIVQSVVEPKYHQWVEEDDNHWTILLPELKKEKKSVQLFFFMTLFQKSVINQKVEVSQVHMHQLLAIINHPKPQMTMDLGNGWEFCKSYDHAYLKMKTQKTAQVISHLDIGEHSFLSEKEWFGIEQVGQPLTMPPVVHNWVEYSVTITKETLFPLILRHREAGDKIKVTPKMTKKVRRLFIDQKIPTSCRDNIWLVCSDNQEIIWIPKFVNSYLSIPKETDKILYRLIYKIRE